MLVEPSISFCCTLAYFRCRLQSCANGGLILIVSAQRVERQLMLVSVNSYTALTPVWAGTNQEFMMARPCEFAGFNRYECCSIVFSDFFPAVT